MKPRSGSFPSRSRLAAIFVVGALIGLGWWSLRGPRPGPEVGDATGGPLREDPSEQGQASDEPGGLQPGLAPRLWRFRAGREPPLRERWVRASIAESGEAAEFRLAVRTDGARLEDVAARTALDAEAGVLSGDFRAKPGGAVHTLSMAWDDRRAVTWVAVHPAGSKVRIQVLDRDRSAHRLWALFEVELELPDGYLLDEPSLRTPDALTVVSRDAAPEVRWKLLQFDQAGDDANPSRFRVEAVVPEPAAEPVGTLLRYRVRADTGRLVEATVAVRLSPQVER